MSQGKSERCTLEMLNMGSGEPELCVFVMVLRCLSECPSIQLFFSSLNWFISGLQLSARHTEYYTTTIKKRDLSNLAFCLN